MKIIIVTIFTLIGVSCSTVPEQIAITDEELGENPAGLTIILKINPNDKEKDSFFSRAKLVTVKILQYPSCENGKRLSDVDEMLGKSTLTTSENQRTISIPSEQPLAINVMRKDKNPVLSHIMQFIPEKNKAYTLLIENEDLGFIFNRDTLRTVILEKIDNHYIASDSANYVHLSSFMAHTKLNYCKEPIKGCKGSLEASDIQNRNIIKSLNCPKSSKITIKSRNRSIPVEPRPYQPPPVPHFPR